MAARRLTFFAATVAFALAMPSGMLAQPKSAPTKPTLDYGFYKNKVEPIFLRKKEGHVRCVVCHAESNNNFRLSRLDDGAKTWTDAESRKNFEVVSKLVNPGDPDTSLLTKHPLAPEAGGDAFHSGGRQFGSKKDKDWKTLVAFVNGAKAK